MKRGSHSGNGVGLLVSFLCGLRAASSPHCSAQRRQTTKQTNGMSFLSFQLHQTNEMWSLFDWIAEMEGRWKANNQTNQMKPRCGWIDLVGYELPAPLRATTPKANSLLVPFLCGLACLLRKGKRRAHANHKPTKRGNPTLSLCLVLCWLRVWEQ